MGPAEEDKNDLETADDPDLEAALDEADGEDGVPASEVMGGVREMIRAIAKATGKAVA